MAVPYSRMASRCQCGSLSAVSAGQRPEPRRLPRTVVPTAREYQGQIRSRPEAYMEAPDGTSEDFEHRKMLAGFGGRLPGKARTRDLAGSPFPGPELVCEAPGLASRSGSAGGIDGGWLKVLRPVCDYIGVMRSPELGRGRPGGSRAARCCCRRGRIGAGRMPAEVLCGR
jgi:hypothetical protein